VFRRVLIANRGEIAVRVVRACRRLGIESIAVFSEADRDALHVELADRAVCIGAPRASESYLAIPRILEAAKRSGAEAIHPGYGFLSENAEFAEACAAAGFAFVGPNANAIRQMGSKALARRIARENGVACVPGYDGDDVSLERLQAEARAIGFPVMIKASAGGGGRGIRIVDDEAGFEKAAEAAKREAMGAFGDDHLILERYVRAPRHLEVQVVGDRFGHVVHFFDRECSVQRRHQKLVEEAPAPRLTDAQREELHESALRLARAIGYDNAGTVEYVFDDEAGRAYFLEMNTRLQVEHPVTEMVTGVDLVELQLRVAAGEPLPLGQEDVRAHGCAIEVRVNAEDPAKKFLPRTGRIDHLAWPDAGAESGLRIETGVRSGSEITPHYDSLIAKVVAHGDSRDVAVARLVAALDRAVCFGPANNIGFLREVVDSAPFRAAKLTTHFLDDHFSNGRAKASAPRARPPIPAHAIAALALARESETARAGASAGSVWDRIGAFRLLANAGAPAVAHWFLRDARGGPDALRVVRTCSDGTLDFGEGARAAALRERADGDFELECDGAVFSVRIARFGARTALVIAGERSEFESLPREVAWRTAQRASAGAARSIAAPFPGQVAELRVAAGAKVREDDVVVVLEAMKMLHNLTAASDAVVEEVCCAVGDAVASGQTLVRFRSDGADEAAKKEGAQ